MIYVFRNELDLELHELLDETAQLVSVKVVDLLYLLHELVDPLNHLSFSYFHEIVLLCLFVNEFQHSIFFKHRVSPFLSPNF